MVWEVNSRVHDEGERIVWQPEKNANNELNVENFAVFAAFSRFAPSTERERR